MSALKGFEAAFEEEQETTRPAPRPGTMAHLRQVAEQKRREAGPVDKSLLINPETAIPGGTVPRKIADEGTAIPGGTVSLQGTGINQGTVPRKIADEAEDGEVKILKGYMRFPLEIFDLLATLTDAESRMYLNFVRRTYGRLPARNICSTTFRAIGEAAGLASPNAQVKAFKALEAKGLVKRLFTARSKKETSLFRVYLPCELPGGGDTTEISYESRNRSSKDNG